MKHLPRLGAVALVLALTTAACSEGNRRPISYPGGGVYSRGTGNGSGSARPARNKGGRDETRCNAGRGNGNGNGRCRNGGGNGKRGNE
jgi:hypothetical protein